MPLTQTEENYLKTIFTIIDKDNGTIGTNDIAQAINTSASSVTDMLKKLSEKKLIKYEKYKPVKLSAKGRKTATDLIRKHRLWETFLVKNLGFNWSDVHEIAEQMEHIQSAELVTKLDNYLGKPQFDPHGEPIPDSEGHFPQRAEIVLSEMKLGMVGKLSSVEEDDQSFLKVLDKLEIKIGTTLKVIEVIDFDESMLILINDCDEKLLSKKICSNLYISTK